MGTLNKEFFVRVLIYIIGLIILTFGVAIFVATDNGADPFSMVMIGVSNRFDMVTTMGNAGILLNIIIIVVILFVDKSYIKAGTIIAISGGMFIDFFLTIVKEPIGQIGTVFNITIMIASLLILSLGIAILISSNIGAGAYDLIGVVIQGKMGIKIKVIRPIYDGIAILTGVLLGARFGFGTILSMVLVGPLIQIMLKYTDRYIPIIVTKFVKQ
jgi:uncharacterized protein